MLQLLYLDCAQVHGLLDDVMVVMETKRCGVHRLVERPGVRRVLLGQQLLQHAAAVAKLRRQLAAPHRRGQDGVRQVFLWGFDGPSADSPPAPCRPVVPHHHPSVAHIHAHHHTRAHSQRRAVVHPQRGQRQRRVQAAAHPQADPAHPHGAHDGHGHGGGSGGVCLPLHPFFLWWKRRG